MNPNPATDSNGRDQGPTRAILAFTGKELKIFKGLKTGGQPHKPIIGGMTKVLGWPDLVLVGPVLGAPQAAMVLEDLSRRGVESVLSLGLCGSLQPHLAWGDIILPTSGYSEEGTSKLYPVEGDPYLSDPELTGRLVESLTRLAVPFAKGRVWSTDAPYRETRDKVTTHAADGILAVDMEASAMMAVSRFKGMRWAGLMVVSDELWGEKWNPGFDSPRLKEGLTLAAEAILAVWN